MNDATLPKAVHTLIAKIIEKEPGTPLAEARARAIAWWDKRPANNAIRRTPDPAPQQPPKQLQEPNTEQKLAAENARLHRLVETLEARLEKYEGGR